MAHIFQRGKGKVWWIKYYAGGRQVWRSLHTTNARLADRIKREIEGQEARGDLMAPSRTPVIPLLEDYCRFLSTARTRKSYSSDLSILRVFFGPVCDALQPGSYTNKKWLNENSSTAADANGSTHVSARLLEEVTTAKIDNFITRRIREKGIVPKTANRYREVLCGLFKYAIRNFGYASSDRRHPNPAAVVPRRREPPHVIRFLTRRDIDRQLATLKGDATLCAMVALYIYAGLRREEAIWLTPKDVDLERRLIQVEAKTIDGEFWQPKTRRNRVVPISAALLSILKDYAPSVGGRWFFATPSGVRWDPDNLSQRLRVINREHGLVWSCLDFRHTFGSQLAQKGESLYKIAQLMGNSPEICRKHYARLIPEEMHDVVEFAEPNEPRESDPLDADLIVNRILAGLKSPPTNDNPDLRIAR